ncbi:ULK3 isoform 10 [Pongo abelii]|uniref:ULK3 isoform 10 n=1 Tax=Pongo abelii TaxID=9601 RepID=A0A2J8UDD1_PONAB|nr:ULK3 isoform 9 [Pongo abelii]PNJ43280.1 ULK3 isoform 10 [Pongo abelii]
MQRNGSSSRGLEKTRLRLCREARIPESAFLTGLTRESWEARCWCAVEGHS